MISLTRTGHHLLEHPRHLEQSEKSENYVTDYTYTSNEISEFLSADLGWTETSYQNYVRSLLSIHGI